MGRISFAIERCTRCRMHKSLCVCSFIRPMYLQTQIILISHVREYVKISATGPLALECLPNSELLIHGRRENPLDLNRFLNPERRALILFPRPGVQPLTREMVESDSRPITLVVPDGNWAQASKMARRLPGVEHFSNVTLPDGQQTQWGLRKETHSDGLATFEAIARAIGIIESPLAQQKMEALFDEMVSRTKRLRGAAI
ncbi:MAG: DTW domain-containing protein [Deltaproteobacteria bacterium]|nr:DTW domain-containing protein [Deltaproteobacteria bacterium]MBN2670513.1 DTW domain-containing protein [Deltaproteobacteria bacterium]